MKTLTLAAALAALPLTAVVAQMPVPAAPAYVKMAGAGDKYEIESSRMLLQTTKDAKLRSFAETMIAHHTKSTADVAAAARSAGMTPGMPMLDAEGTRNVAALRAARGTARDRLYVTQQKASHAKALALHQGYAADGDVPALKTAAGTIVPVVQGHIDMLATM